MPRFWFVSNVGISDPDAPGPVGTPPAAPEPEPDPVPDCRLRVVVVKVALTVLQSSTHPKHRYTPHPPTRYPPTPETPSAPSPWKRSRPHWATPAGAAEHLGGADDGLKLGRLVPPQPPPALLLLQHSPFLLFFTPPIRTCVASRWRLDRPAAFNAFSSLPSQPVDHPPPQRRDAELRHEHGSDPGVPLPLVACGGNPSLTRLQRQ